MHGFGHGVSNFCHQCNCSKKVCAIILPTDANWSECNDNPQQLQLHRHGIKNPRQSTAAETSARKKITVLCAVLLLGSLAHLVLLCRDEWSGGELVFCQMVDDDSSFGAKKHLHHK